MYPSVDEGPSFDAIFDEEMFRLAAQNDDGPDPLDSFEDLFEQDTSPNTPYRILALSDKAKIEQSPPNPWRKGLWSLNQRQPSELTVSKTRNMGTNVQLTAHSTGLASPSRHNAHHVRLPKGSSSTCKTKRYATSPNAAGLPTSTAIHPSLLREASLSPSPMYSQLSSARSKPHGDVNNWQLDFQNFHLRPEYEQFPSSPSVCWRAHNATSAQAMNMSIVARNQGTSVPLSTYVYKYEAKGESVIDPLLLETQDDNLRPGEVLHDPLPQPGRQHKTEHDPSTSPLAESLPSTGSSQSHRVGTDTSQTSYSVQSQTLSFPTSCSVHPALPKGALEDTYPMLVAPSPQRVPQVLHTTEYGSLTGLGIRYPGLEQMEEAVLYESPVYYGPVPGQIGLAVPYGPAPGLTSGQPAGYPVVQPPGPQHVFSNASPFTTPRKVRHERSRSVSPSVSPTHVSPRRQCQRSPSRADGGRQRRKSIHKTGPMKEDGACEPPTCARARARSQSRPPRIPKTPKTPKTPTGLVGFVNFTPKDASKLLSDVAPSGSSKTRARRDQEAREKRKRLSEAALKAVKVAGGDVSLFEKAIMA